MNKSEYGTIATSSNCMLLVISTMNSGTLQFVGDGMRLCLLAIPDCSFTVMVRYVLYSILS